MYERQTDGKRKKGARKSFVSIVLDLLAICFKGNAATTQTIATRASYTQTKKKTGRESRKRK